MNIRDITSKDKAPEEKSRVRAAVKRKFPAIGKSSSKYMGKPPSGKR